MANRFEEASSAVRDLIQKNKLISEGRPARYRLITTRSDLAEDGSVRKWTFGQQGKNKQKTVLMVGETGTGKTTLINSMVNFTLGIKFTDQVWFEVTDEREVNPTANQKSDQSKSQTNKITVYEVFPKNNPVSLTIIDTPGYGDTRGLECDQKIAENLYKLFKNETGVKEIDAVCLVVKASENRLSDRQQYIFDAVLSLFGKDIENNIVIFFTHSGELPPTDAINAVKTAKIPCRKDEENEPVYFLFNNCQAKERTPKYKRALKSAWELTEDSFNDFFASLKDHNRKSLEQTTSVLKEQEGVKAFISDLQERIKSIENKSKELEEIKKKLEGNREKIKKNEDFTFTVTTYYKDIVEIENAAWEDQKATRCTECKRNCHEKGCWSAANAWWCYVMKNDHCTVCKCHYTKHVRENMKYIEKPVETIKSFYELKKTYSDKQSAAEISLDSNAFQNVKNDFDSSKKEEEKHMNLEKKLKDDLTEKQNEKNKLVKEACTSIITLSEIALKPASAFIVESIEFLIPRAEESGIHDLTQMLKNLKTIDTESQEQIQSAQSYFSKLKNWIKKRFRLLDICTFCCVVALILNRHVIFNLIKINLIHPE